MVKKNDKNSKLVRFWRRNTMKFAHHRVLGRVASRLARIGLPPLYGRLSLVRHHPKGYFSPDAVVHHGGFQSDAGCYLSDGVHIFEDTGGGTVWLGEGVQLHENNTLQTGDSGQIEIGAHTHVQPRCQFSAYIGKIVIGEHVEIAPQCAFYPYNHSMDPAELIQKQPIFSRSGISVGDGAWIGFGAILLDGAHVGKGAVIAAGSVVSKDVPDMAIAAGVPARVVGTRLAQD